MKISAKARYGLRILMDIALHETADKPRLMKDICEAQSLSEKFTSRLVIPLREAGMIHSLRGKQGGFRLAKSTADITLLEIIETLQGPISLLDCLSEPKTCTRSKTCPTRTIWTDVNSAIKNTFSSITLESILAQIADADHISGVPCEYVI